MVGGDLEVVGHLAQHLTVLPRAAHDGVDGVGSALALVDDGGHLDGLGPRAEEEQWPELAPRAPGELARSLAGDGHARVSRRVR